MILLPGKTGDVLMIVSSLSQRFRLIFRNVGGELFEKLLETNNSKEVCMISCQSDRRNLFYRRFMLRQEK